MKQGLRKWRWSRAIAHRSQCPTIRDLPRVAAPRHHVSTIVAKVSCWELPSACLSHRPFGCPILRFVWQAVSPPDLWVFLWTHQEPGWCEEHARSVHDLHDLHFASIITCQNQNWMEWLLCALTWRPVNDSFNRLSIARKLLKFSARFVYHGLFRSKSYSDPEVARTSSAFTFDS